MYYARELRISMVKQAYQHYKKFEEKIWPTSRMLVQILKLVITAIVLVALMFDFVPGFGESPYNFF